MRAFLARDRPITHKNARPRLREPQFDLGQLPADEFARSRVSVLGDPSDLIRPGGVQPAELHVETGERAVGATKRQHDALVEVRPMTPPGDPLVGCNRAGRQRVEVSVPVLLVLHDLGDARFGLLERKARVRREESARCRCGAGRRLTSAPRRATLCREDRGLYGQLRRKRQWEIGL